MCLDYLKSECCICVSRLFSLLPKYVGQDENGMFDLLGSIDLLLFISFQK
jgi:hypothetical protein